MIGRHFRAGERERTIDSADGLPERIGDDELIWVDLERDDPSLATVVSRLGLAAVADRLRQPSDQPELVRFDGIVVVSLMGLRADEDLPRPVTLDIAAGSNAVLSVRDGRVAGLDDVASTAQGSSEVGRLDAAVFVAVLLDDVVGAFFRALEALERRIDEIDDRTLRIGKDTTLLPALVGVRRDIAVLRRTLAPHRTVVSALARPDLGLRSAGAIDPWPALVDRVERAIDAVENARQLLIGSFDLLMTRAAQRTNDIVRILTVASVTLLPAGVIAGAFGMNFRSPIFDAEGLFLPVLIAIAGLCLAILATARWRGWL